MKKILLVLLALFSLVSLTACGSVKAKKLDIDGSKADEDDLEEFAEKFDEYLEENEFDDQWYSIGMYTSMTADEYGEKEDYKRTVEAEGSYYFAKFAYEQKVKITATILESYEYDDEKVEIKTEITYIYKDGKEYCKEVRSEESETGKSKEVSYNSSAPQELQELLMMRTVMYTAISTFVGCDDLYEIKNGFAGEAEIDNGYEEGLLQVKYEYDEKTYQLKSYETYSEKETDDTVTVTYMKADKKLFGFVNAPRNPEKYSSNK